MADVWAIRSGKYGERDQWALSNGVSGGGWWEVPDLTACYTRDDVQKVVEEVFSSAKPGALPGFTGQLWALRGRIKTGDLLAMPLKTTKEIALGRVTRPYHYLSEESDPSCRHVVGVDWQRTVPRNALKQDLLYTLGSVLTIFSPTRNDGYRRLAQVLESGADPGINMDSLVNRSATAAVEDETVDAPEIAPDIEQVAQDQITSRIGEDFAGHGLAHLVAELMRAEGFTVDEAPPGPDGGIDILAGKGVLGLESPKIVVQVKTGTVERPMIQQLTGLVGSQGADFGLIVTWAGLTGPAREEVRSQRFRIKVWDNTDVVDAVLRNYGRLPEDIRASLPLKQVWVLSDAG